MALELLIDGTDRIDYLRRGSLSISQELHTRSTLDAALSVAGVGMSSSLVSQSGWTVEAVDSEEVGNEATFAFDGSNSTYWSTVDGVGQSAVLKDDFNRTNEGPPPSSSWVNSLGAGCKVSSNALVPNANDTAFYASTWDELLPTDQEAEFEVPNTTADQFSIHTRLQTKTDLNSDHYQLYITKSGSNHVGQIWKRRSGSYTQIPSATDITIGRALTTNDRVKIRVTGTTTVTIEFFLNDVSQGSRTDSSDTIGQGGYVAIAMKGTSGNVLDNFKAGSYVASSTPDAYPHTLDIDLGAEHELVGVQLTQRQDSQTGRVKDFELWIAPDVSGSPGTYVQALDTTLADNTALQEFSFSASTGRFVRFKAIDAHDAGAVAILAEINLLEGGTISFYRPVVGEEIIAKLDGTKIFAGTIESTEESSVKGVDDHLEIAISAVSWEQLLDRKLVAKSFTNKDVRDIVLEVMSDHLTVEGITEGQITTGPTIENAPFNYVSVNDVFNELAGLVAYEWYIDHDKKLFFVPCGTTSAPISLTSGSQYLNLTVSRGRQDYRNKQFVRAGRDVTESRVERFAGDGERRTFTLAFPVAIEPTITLDSVAKTVGIRGVDDEDSKDFFYQIDSNEINHSNDQTVLSSANKIEVTYKGFFPLLVLLEEQSEIAARKAIEGGSGIYENIEDREEIDSASFAFDLATGLLRRKGLIPDVLNFDTRALGLRPGQTMTVNLPIHSLTDDFLISAVEFNELETEPPTFLYSVEALTGEALGGWAEFFQRLAKAGRRFVVRENEVVGPLIFLSEPTNMTETVMVSSITAKIGEFDVDEVEHCEFG